MEELLELDALGFELVELGFHQGHVQFHMVFHVFIFYFVAIARMSMLASIRHLPIILYCK